MMDENLHNSFHATKESLCISCTENHRNALYDDLQTSSYSVFIVPADLLVLPVSVASQRSSVAFDLQKNFSEPNRCISRDRRSAFLFVSRCSVDNFTGRL